MKRKKRKISLPFGRWTAGFLGLIRSLFVRLVPVAAWSVVFVLAFYGIRESLYADDFFKLETIKTQTDGVLRPEEIQAIAGVRIGQNLFKLNLDAIAGKLNADSRIRWCVVERVFPKEMTIRVRERRSFLRMKTPLREAPQVIDRDGFYLGDSPKDSSLAMLSDLRQEAKSYFGTKSYKDKDLLALASGLSSLFSKDPLFEKMSLLEIQVYDPYRIHIIWTDGFEVRVGKNWKASLKKLDAVRSVVREEMPEIEYIDLRYNDVVIKKKDKKKAAKKTARP